MKKSPGSLKSGGSSSLRPRETNRPHSRIAGSVSLGDWQPLELTVSLELFGALARLALVAMTSIPRAETSSGRQSSSASGTRQTGQ
jgi:hypothetical protein